MHSCTVLLVVVLLGIALAADRGGMQPDFNDDTNQFARRPGYYKNEKTTDFPYAVTDRYGTNGDFLFTRPTGNDVIVVSDGDGFWDTTPTTRPPRPDFSIVDDSGLITTISTWIPIAKLTTPTGRPVRTRGTTPPPVIIDSIAPRSTRPGRGPTPVTTWRTYPVVNDFTGPPSPTPTIRSPVSRPRWKISPRPHPKKTTYSSIFRPAFRSGLIANDDDDRNQKAVLKGGPTEPPAKVQNSKVPAPPSRLFGGEPGSLDLNRLLRYYRYRLRELNKERAEAAKALAKGGPFKSRDAFKRIQEIEGDLRAVSETVNGLANSIEAEKNALKRLEVSRINSALREVLPRAQKHLKKYGGGH